MNDIICLFDLMKSKKKIILLAFYLLVIISSVIIFYHVEYGSIPTNELIAMKKTDPEIGLDFFYVLQDSGLILVLFIASLLLLPNLISSDFLSYKINAFDHMIIVRTSDTQYRKDSRRMNFLVTVFVIILTHVLTLLTIQLFCFNISFSINDIYQDATRNTTIFSPSLLMSLITYIILSAIGYGVFSDFIYSLQVLIKNLYLYRTLGLILALFAYIGSSVLSRILFDTGLGTLPATLAYFMNIINILTPGIIKSPVLANTPILFYIGTIAFYGLIGSLFFDLKEKTDYENI